MPKLSLGGYRLLHQRQFDCRGWQLETAVLMWRVNGHCSGRNLVTWRLVLVLINNQFARKPATRSTCSSIDRPLHLLQIEKLLHSRLLHLDCAAVMDQPHFKSEYGLLSWVLEPRHSTFHVCPSASQGQPAPTLSNRAFSRSLPTSTDASLPIRPIHVAQPFHCCHRRSKKKPYKCKFGISITSTRVHGFRVCLLLSPYFIFLFYFFFPPTFEGETLLSNLPRVVSGMCWTSECLWVMRFGPWLQPAALSAGPNEAWHTHSHTFAHICYAHAQTRNEKQSVGLHVYFPIMDTLKCISGC